MSKKQLLMKVRTYFVLLVCISCKNDDSTSDLIPSDPIEIGSGSAFNGLNGVYFGENDNHIYAASALGSEIGVIDVTTGKIEFRLTMEDGVEGPDDLVIDSESNIYWTAIFSGEVGKLTPGGELTKQFVAPGVNPITFDEKGRLFVALDFLGDGLYELDPALITTPQLLIDAPIGFINGMDFGPDEWLYGPIWTMGKVVKVNIETLEMIDVVSGFTTASALKFSPDEKLYVLEYVEGEIYSVAIKTKEKTLIIKDDRLKGLDNLAFNSIGDLFVTNAFDGAMYNVDIENGLLKEVLPGSFIYAGDIALESNGDLLIGDVFSLKKMGSELEMLERHYIGLPGMILPLTLDRMGDELLLSSWFDNAVQVWNYKSGKEIQFYYDYTIPINAIFSSEGALVVAELGAQPGAAKVTLQQNGNRVTLMDGLDGLLIPSGLATNSMGDVFVADYGSGSIYKVVEEHDILEEPALVIDGLLQPEGIKVTDNGKLIVAETGKDRIISIDLMTLEIITIAETSIGKQGPTGTPPFWILSDLDIDNNGHVYFTSDVENKIYKVENAY